MGTNQLATEVIQFCAGLLFKHFKAQGMTADIYEGKLRETAIVPFNLYLLYWIKVIYNFLFWS